METQIKSKLEKIFRGISDYQDKPYYSEEVRKMNNVIYEHLGYLYEFYTYALLDQKMESTFGFAQPKFEEEKLNKLKVLWSSGTPASMILRRYTESVEDMCAEEINALSGDRKLRYHSMLCIMTSGVFPR